MIQANKFLKIIYVYLLLSVLYSVKQQHGGHANLFLAVGLMAGTRDPKEVGCSISQNTTVYVLLSLLLG
jgi:hypothetical protein